MFPHPIPLVKPTATADCVDCGTPARVDLMIAGHGSGCARKAGLVGRSKDVGQSGADLIDMLNEITEAEDRCDGWDR